MTINLNDVKRFADLARLDLDETEAAVFQKQLASILAHFEKLQTVDVARHTPVESADHTDTLREDIAQSAMAHIKLLNNAPQEQDGQFKIPPVFNHD